MVLEFPITLIYYPEVSQSLAPPFSPSVVVFQNPSSDSSSYPSSYPSSSTAAQSEPVPLQS